EQDRAFGRGLIEQQDFLLHAFIWLIWLRHVAILQVGGKLCSADGKKIVEVIDHAAFVEQLLQSIVAREIRLQILNRRAAFVSQREFDFPKLHRLKSRRGLEPVAKT